MSTYELEVDREVDTWVGKEVSGVATVRESFEDEKGTIIHFLPFRSQRLGGKMKDEHAEQWRGHGIWLWENPDDPVADITLSPSYKVSKTHFKVEEGEVVEK